MNTNSSISQIASTTLSDGIASRINSSYTDAYNRAFNAVRNRIVITPANIGQNLRVRVLGQGTPVTRAGGLIVMLFNTNVMLGADLAAAVAKLKPAAFNAVAEQGDEAVTLYLRDVLNTGSIPFTVPMTNRQIHEVGQGATVDCTIADIVIKNGDRAGEATLALNFNRVIPAGIGQSAQSAFDALMAADDSGVVASSTGSTSSAPDPFASAPATAAPRGRRGATAPAAV